MKMVVERNIGDWQRSEQKEKQSWRLNAEGVAGRSWTALIVDKAAC